MAPFERPATSSVQGLSKPAVKQSLADDANNRACSGRSPEPKTSSPYDVSAPADAWMSSGKTDPMPTLHETIVSHWQSKRRIVSHAPSVPFVPLLIDNHWFPNLNRWLWKPPKDPQTL